jgi:hypothetical protein
MCDALIHVMMILANFANYNLTLYHFHNNTYPDGMTYCYLHTKSLNLSGILMERFGLAGVFAGSLTAFRGLKACGLMGFGVSISISPSCTFTNALFLRVSLPSLSCTMTSVGPALTTVCGSGLNGGDSFPAPALDYKKEDVCSIIEAKKTPFPTDFDAKKYPFFIENADIL